MIENIGFASFLGFINGTLSPDGPDEPDAFAILDAENGQYFVDGVEVEVDDLFVVDSGWSTEDPPYAIGAGGFTSIDGVLASGLYDALAPGFTVVVEMTGSAMANNNNFNIALLDLPGFSAILQCRISPLATNCFNYTGNDSIEELTLVNDVRTKLGFVAQPGTKWSFIVNGILGKTEALGLPGTPPTDICIFSWPTKIKVHKITFYQGALTDEQVMALTS